MLFQVYSYLVDEILDRPDGCEKGSVEAITMRNPLSHLNSALENVFAVRISPKYYDDAVNVKLFNPHERVVDSSNVIPLEVNTSVVAFDAYRRVCIESAGVKVGSILLFKLSANINGEPAPYMTAKDLVWGNNCLYGAFMDGSAISYFEIVQTSGDVVEAELRRKDQTEESGQSVEMQVVKPGRDQLVIQKLPSSNNKVFELLRDRKSVV